MKQFLRRPFLVALLLSLAVHFLPAAASLITLPDWPWRHDDDVVSRKAGGELAKVALAAKKPAARAPARTGPTVVYLIAAAPVATTQSKALPPSPKPKHHAHRPPHPTASKTTEVAQAPPPVAAEAPDEDPFDAALTAVTPTTATEIEAPPVSAAPADHDGKPAAPPPEGLRFPPRISARYQASYFGLSVAMDEHWQVDGDTYRIELSGSKFGYAARMVSRGKVTPNGLQPANYTTYLNSKDTPKNYAEFTASSLRYGKPSDRHETGLTALPQDILSFQYHIAIAYDGKQPLPMLITTGNSVYEVAIGVEAEEVIRTPAGEIRTVHLKGSRKHQDGHSQDGYELWLAPDYRNFPVKLRGPDSSGRIMELVLMALNFDGETVLGKDAPQLADEGDPGTLPVELLQKHGVDAAVPAAP